MLRKKNNFNIFDITSASIIIRTEGVRGLFGGGERRQGLFGGGRTGGGGGGGKVTGRGCNKWKTRCDRSMLVRKRRLIQFQ